MLLMNLEWVTEDVNSHSYMDRLQYGEEGKVFHGRHPSHKENFKRVFGRSGLVHALTLCNAFLKLTPNAFEHQQLEMVQHEQLQLHINSITKTNGPVVF